MESRLAVTSKIRIRHPMYSHVSDHSTRPALFSSLAANKRQVSSRTNLYVAIHISCTPLSTRAAIHTALRWAVPFLSCEIITRKGFTRVLERRVVSFWGFKERINPWNISLGSREQIGEVVMALVWTFPWIFLYLTRICSTRLIVRVSWRPEYIRCLPS